jgi:hypothetical protein
MASSPKIAPGWQLREQVVAALERAVAPGAAVVHNVRLPVIGSPTKRRRQCDVVITAGQPPRQTMAIVEVQKRGRRVTLGDFESWLVKMKSVGAHQLICVSQHAFPNSVLEVAAQHGPIVELLTLDPSQPKENLPVTMVGMVVNNLKFEVTEFTSGLMLEPKLAVDGPRQIQTEAPLLSVDDEVELISVNSLLLRILNNEPSLQLPPHSAPAFVLIDLGSSDSQVWFHEAGKKALVKRWVANVKLTVETTNAPMTLSNVPYTEHGQRDPLAWASQAIMPLNGINHAVTFALRTQADGSLYVQVDAARVD